MSDFIHGLVQRGAGLPSVTIVHPPAVPPHLLAAFPLGGEDRGEGDTAAPETMIEIPAETAPTQPPRLAEGEGAGRAVGAASLRLSALTERAEVSERSPDQPVPARPAVASRGRPRTAAHPAPPLLQPLPDAGRGGMESPAPSPDRQPSAEVVVKPTPTVPLHVGETPVQAVSRTTPEGPESSAPLPRRPAPGPAPASETMRHTTYDRGDGIAEIERQVPNLEPRTSEVVIRPAAPVASSAAMPVGARPPAVGGRDRISPARPSERREIRVSIGRVEVRATTPPPPPAAPPPRGFDDYVLARSYLERVWF